MYFNPFRKKFPWIWYLMQAKKKCLILCGWMRNKPQINCLFIFDCKIWRPNYVLFDGIPQNHMILNFSNLYLFPFYLAIVDSDTSNCETYLIYYLLVFGYPPSYNGIKSLTIFQNKSSGNIWCKISAFTTLCFAFSTLSHTKNTKSVT